MIEKSIDALTNSVNTLNDKLEKISELLNNVKLEADEVNTIEPSFDDDLRNEVEEAPAPPPKKEKPKPPPKKTATPPPPKEEAAPPPTETTEFDEEETEEQRAAAVKTLNEFLNVFIDADDGRRDERIAQVREILQPYGGSLKAIPTSKFDEIQATLSSL